MENYKLRVNPEQSISVQLKVKDFLKIGETSVKRKKKKKKKPPAKKDSPVITGIDLADGKDETVYYSWIPEKISAKQAKAKQREIDANQADAQSHNAKQKEKHSELQRLEDLSCNGLTKTWSTNPITGYIYYHG